MFGALFLQEGEEVAGDVVGCWGDAKQCAESTLGQRGRFRGSGYEGHARPLRHLGGSGANRTLETSLQDMYLFLDDHALRYGCAPFRQHRRDPR